MVMRIDELPPVVDIDSHEMTPLHHWGHRWGNDAGRFADYFALSTERFAGSDNNMNRPGLEDVMPVTAEAIWEIRGPDAPGAFDMARRLDVLDAMGVDCQMVFPTGPVMACFLLHGDDFLVRDTWNISAPRSEYGPVMRATVESYNRWAGEQTRLSGGRLRFVGMPLADSPAELIEVARRQIADGVGAINLLAGIPPAGVSPADPALDPLWQLMQDSDVPVVLHVGGQFGFTASATWGRAPAFKPGKIESTEFGFEQYSMSVLHYAYCNFLTVMVMGGVFERFPGLRFAVCEAGGYWLGPLAESLDMWAANVFRKRMSEILTLKPSEYLNRNVRVNPFPFENVAEYFQHYPQLSDCFCFSTDYPHVEGGKHSKRTFYEQLAPLGDEVLEKYFVSNGALLMPR